MRKKQRHRSEPLFCPFCGEAFEGVRECPEHELELLPLDRLSRSTRALEGVTFFVDPRLGRGPVLFGTMLALIGFGAPFARTRALVASALEIAIEGAHNLWLTPLAAIAVLAILWLRRSAGAMRAGGLAVSLLSVAGWLPLLYTARRIEIVSAQTTTEVDWGWGLFMMAGGLALAALGGLRLGRRDRLWQRAHRPH